MSEKRKRNEDHAPRKGGDKKPRKGFTVGPANLPDGTYKRKTLKIKNALIEKAQIRKEYAKLKKQGKIPDEPEALPVPASLRAEQAEQHDEDSNEAADKPSEPHPDRQNLIERAANNEDEDVLAEAPQTAPRHRQRKPKHAPFQRDYEDAQKRKAEAEERRKAREQAEKQRQQKIEERQRFRSAMAKARTGGPNGQRKLGRESKALLEKVKRMVSEG